MIYVKRDYEAAQAEIKSFSRGISEFSFMIEPSMYISQTFVNYYKKFGIIDISDSLLQYTKKKKALRFSIYPHPLTIHEKILLSGNIHDNSNGLFKTAYENHLRGNSVFLTPFSAALFLDEAANQNILIEPDYFESEVSIDEIANLFIDSRYNDFSPHALERLLKLFMLFHKKDMTKNMINKIGIIQIHLINLAKMEDEINLNKFSFDGAISVSNEIERIKKERYTNITGLSLANKLIENFSKFVNLIYKKNTYSYEMIDGYSLFQIQREKTLEEKQNFAKRFRRVLQP